MSRQPMLRLRLVGRLTVGLLGIATALLLAPPAMAQPEVEANNAIAAAWEAGGGDTGPLGPRTGDVYPAGDGFAQNFASGKMFFTPATGAHFMQGAILEKYESLGGPADSDLGFPTIDEGPGRAPDSRNSTFSAPDNPVIFWTPATGARVVRGAINAAWDKLGGSSGVLGVPAEDETYDGPVVRQKFTGGELIYDSATKTFTTVPPELAGPLADLEVPDDPISAINAARRAAGGALGPLGAAEGEPYEIGDDGMGQDFVNGKIFYSPQTGANVVTGQVLAKYESVGGPEGDLGFPATGEQDGGQPGSRMSTFAAEDKPVIFWTPDHGAVIVRGAINAAWDKLGGATGELGAPVADQTQNGDVVTQRFSGGAISWDTATRKFSTEPAGLGPQLVGLEVPGEQAAPEAIPPQAQASDNSESSGLKWTWWWLLAIVPLVLLAGLVAFAVVRSRSRRGEVDPFAPTDDDSGRGYEPALANTQTAHEEGREDELFGERYAREGVGSLGSAATPSTSGEPQSNPPEFWGSQTSDEDAHSEPAADHTDPDTVDTAPTRVLMPVAETLSHDVPDDHGADDHGAWDDTTAQGEIAADREPFVAHFGGPVEAPAEAAPPARDPMTDTGRHARIDVDEPLPFGTALHMPFDDPGEIPEGYPIKADTKSGLYWAPDSADYHEAPVEIWFATEEIARTNGFVRGE